MENCEVKVSENSDFTSQPYHYNIFIRVKALNIDPEEILKRVNDVMQCKFFFEADKSKTIFITKDKNFNFIKVLSNEKISKDQSQSAVKFLSDEEEYQISVRIDVFKGVFPNSDIFFIGPNVYDNLSETKEELTNIVSKIAKIDNITWEIRLRRLFDGSKCWNLATSSIKLNKAVLNYFKINSKFKLPNDKTLRVIEGYHNLKKHFEANPYNRSFEGTNSYEDRKLIMFNIRSLTDDELFEVVKSFGPLQYKPKRQETNGKYWAVAVFKTVESANNALDLDHSHIRVTYSKKSNKQIISDSVEVSSSISQTDNFTVESHNESVLSHISTSNALVKEVDNIKDSIRILSNTIAQQKDEINELKQFYTDKLRDQQHHNELLQQKLDNLTGKIDNNNNIDFNSIISNAVNTAISEFKKQKLTVIDSDNESESSNKNHLSRELRALQNNNSQTATNNNNNNSNTKGKTIK